MLAQHLEKVIFHHVLSNKEYIEVVKDNFFETPEFGTLYAYAKAFTNKYNAAPSKKQLMEIVKLKDTSGTIKPDFIEGLYDIDMSQYETDWLNENVVAWIEFKNLDKSVENIVSFLKLTKIDNNNIKDVVEKCKDMMVSQNNLDFGFDSGLDFFDPQSHVQPTWDTFSTGFDYLDTVLGGGWATKSLYILAGMMKVGKCTSSDTLIRIRHKKTNEIKEITIGEFFMLIKKSL